MAITHLDPERLHASPFFSQGVVAETGRTLYVGGQNGTDSEGMIEGELAEQTTQALRNVLTVLEAAELKKLLEEKWGVTAAVAAPMMMAAMPGAAGAAAPAEEAEEQTEFNVILSDVGPEKINVIKVIRTITNLGLKEAKDLVESAPATVLEGVNKDAANDAKSKLEAVKAKVDVK